MIYLIQTPAPTDCVSGGYRFNEEMGKRLESALAGSRIDVEAQDLEARCAALSKDDPDAVLVFDSLFMDQVDPGFLGTSLLRATKTILLLHYLPSRNPNLDAERRHVLETAERRWIEATDSVISAGSKLARLLADRHRSLQVRVVHPGVEPCFRRQRSPRRAASDTPFTLVSVANLIPDKGQRELAAICTELAAEGLDLRLILVGDEHREPSYTNEVREAACGFQLDVTGTLSIDEVAARLEEAHVFVSTSSYENFATACVEAAAFGIPVVSYSVGDLGYWVRDEENGLLVDPGDLDGLRAKLRSLMREPNQLDALHHGPAREAFPTWESSFEDFLTTCEAVRVGVGRTPELDVSFYSRCQLPTGIGTFQVEVYKVGGENEALLISMGDLAGEEAPFVRVHSECFTGEVLDSLKCDCRDQLVRALRIVADKGRGAVVYLRQEGRGIGLGNKIRAYAEQERGANTVEANTILGFPIDLRDFGPAAQILSAKGVKRVHMNTNNPAKVASLQENGIVVESVLSSASRPNPHNLDYLRTKYRLLGHAGLERGFETLDRKETEASHALFSEIVSRTVPRVDKDSSEGSRRLVLFDLDGVIQFGDHVPEEAIRLVQRCREAGFTLRFLSNDGCNSRRTRLQSLREAGLVLGDDELYTASYLAARYVKEHGLAKVLPLIGEPAAQEFDGLTCSNAAEAKAVVIGDWFPHYEYSRLKEAYAALEKGAELLAMHKKRHWPVGDTKVIDIGFWVAGLEYCAGREATLIGKPSAFAYESVLRDAGFAASQAIMIADEVDPDLLGAERLGIQTLLYGEHESDSVARVLFGGPVLGTLDAVWEEIKLFI